MSASYLPKVSRRTTFGWLAAAIIPASVQRADAERTTVIAFGPLPGGYGTDPNLKQPTVPWHLTMNEQQLQLTAILADLILPASETSPAPSHLGVSDFLNEWVSAPYPDQIKDRSTLFTGLRRLDDEAGRRWGRGFLDIDHAAQLGMVDEMALEAADIASPQNFFQRFRFLVVGAYYTTPEGLRDIGYTGNVPLPHYPAITEEERAILEKALSGLGL